MILAIADQRGAQISRCLKPIDSGYVDLENPRQRRRVAQQPQHPIYYSAAATSAKAPLKKINNEVGQESATGRKNSRLDLRQSHEPSWLYSFFGAAKKEGLRDVLTPTDTCSPARLCGGEHQGRREGMNSAGHLKILIGEAGRHRFEDPERPHRTRKGISLCIIMRTPVWFKCLRENHASPPKHPVPPYLAPHDCAKTNIKTVKGERTAMARFKASWA